jgi:hypothetical protein
MGSSQGRSFSHHLALLEFDPGMIVSCRTAGRTPARSVQQFLSHTQFEAHPFPSFPFDDALEGALGTCRIQVFTLF